MTRYELAEMLTDMPAGEAFHLPYDAFADLFPPGEPDEGARTRAVEFAKLTDCLIENRPESSEVLFVKPS
jgi:hypothetical protein